MGRHDVDWDAVPLGKASDQDLAERLGVSRQAVSIARSKRGIPRWVTPFISRGSAEVLRDCVYDAIGRYDVRTVTDIYHRVINDYGSCHTRGVYRALHELLAQGKIKRVREDPADSTTWGYVRC